MLIYGQPDVEDESEITELYETYLNAGDSVREYVREGLHDDGYVGVKCVDSETGKMVGILSARPGIQFTYEHPELEERIRKQWGSEGIYTADMLIVDPAYRHLGIAKQMAVRLQEGLRRHHVTYIVLEAWMRSKEHDIPADATFKTMGAAELITVDRHFYKDLARYGLTCPECGANCRCGAEISMIKLNDPQSEEQNA